MTKYKKMTGALKAPKSTTRYASALAVFAFAFGFANCSSEVPVQELADARLEIDKAEMEKAETYASDKLTAARTALVEAHGQLAEGENTEAKAGALSAKELAREARIQSAPEYSQELQKKAEEAIAEAEDSYAEKLAEDDFAAAKQLKSEGDDAKSSANEKLAASDGMNDIEAAQNDREALDEFNTAYRKYEASIKAAEKAEATALSQKGDMASSLDGVDAMLAKAREYGAEENATAEYNAAEEAADSARSSLEAGDLKEGGEKVAEAEKLAARALAEAAESYSAQRKEEAAKKVAGARSIYGNYKKSASSADAKSMEEYLSAAEEALSAANSEHNEENYEESIRESNEAIRLTQIIAELAGGEVASRDANEGDWKSYTVKKTVPAESLWRIAGKKDIYGNSWLWKRIYEANKDIIKNPNLIYPNQKLSIPPKEGSAKKPEGNDADEVDTMSEDEEPADYRRPEEPDDEEM